MNSVDWGRLEIRSYLLGTVPSDQASVMEERYFADRSFFSEVRSMEVDLVCEFLDGKLTENELEHFKRRYLSIPRLKKLVDQVARRRQPSKSSLPILPKAGDVVLVCHHLLTNPDQGDISIFKFSEPPVRLVDKSASWVCICESCFTANPDDPLAAATCRTTWREAIA